MYRFPTPFTPGQSATLVLVGPLGLGAQAGVVTGGDLHPCEHRLLIRTYGALYEFTSAASLPFEDVFAAAPVQVPVASEPQGEAVTFRSDGFGYLTASEKAGGANPALHTATCK